MLSTAGSLRVVAGQVHRVTAARAPRVAFVTNLCPDYRRPLFELLARRLDVTFYFFSVGTEWYLGELRHEPGHFPVEEAAGMTLAGHPLQVGLASALSRERYDVVIKCMNGRLMVPYVYALARARRIPFVLWSGMWRHPRTPAHRLTRPLVERIYRGAEAVVAYGDHVRRFVESVPGVDGRKVYVAGQAIDAAPFSEVDPPFVEPPEFLFTGRLEEHKGVRDLLTAFAGVEDRGARLRLVGSGSLEEYARAHARSDSRIEVLGQVPRRELPAALARARCLVLPSVTTDRFREPWGLVVNEAMAAGVPVITSDAVGAVGGGLVRNGRNGLTVPERRPAALAAAMRTLGGDAQLARTLGAQARMDVSRFDYARMSRAFLAAVEHSMAGDRQGAHRTGAGFEAWRRDR
jgi:glycosyltransferase involved in cell wall biosynthesis